jgi:cellulose synthase/poly-beta-1,6-N-acetylglucosamine synthase-like glycosyltransferase
VIGWFLIVIYFTASFGLVLYGLNCYLMVFLFLKGRKKAALSRRLVLKTENLNPSELPRVTTQIPLFNEFNVAERVIHSVCSMDYPAGRHEIQILDDSNDETAELVAAIVRDYSEKGVDIVCVRRENREGFKAGALKAGLESAKGDLVAIFDADFVPPQDFLRQTVPFFIHDGDVGLVQARWGHLNASRSWLTKAQALGIDGHFMVEQGARNFNGLFMNFNGTAGIFRKSAIVDAGGWQADTLTEDMDLSYRIQMRGWRCVYQPDLRVPGEIPEDIRSFKSQQFRWAKGSMETALKLLPAVFASDVPLFTKIQAFFHMTHYMVHPLMLAVAVLSLPVMNRLNESLGRLAPSVFLAAALVLLLSMGAPSVLYITARRHDNAGEGPALGIIPFLVIVGTGIALSNSRAVFEALAGKKSGFVRTPKRGDRAEKRYRVRLPVSSMLEFVLGLYCFFSFISYLDHGKYLVGPFLAVYAFGFLVTGIVYLGQAAGYGKP